MDKETKKDEKRACVGVCECEKVSERERVRERERKVISRHRAAFLLFVCCLLRPSALNLSSEEAETISARMPPMLLLLQPSASEMFRLKPETKK